MWEEEEGGVRMASIAVIEGVLGEEAAGGGGDGMTTLSEVPGTPTVVAILWRN